MLQTATKSYIKKLVKRYYNQNKLGPKMTMPCGTYDIGKALYRIREYDADNRGLFAFDVDSFDEYDCFQIVTRVDVLNSDVVLMDGPDVVGRSSEVQLVDFLLSLDKMATNMKGTTDEMKEREKTLYSVISEKPKNYRDILEELHQRIFAFIN